MNRTRVDSTSIHSIGHDPSGLEVQFHSKGCAMRTGGTDAKDPECTCEGGEVFHYPGVSADDHRDLMAADSVGSHFAYKIRNAKDPHGNPKFPGSKRSP